jgi:hypothetical protein
MKYVLTIHFGSHELTIFSDDRKELERKAKALKTQEIDGVLGSWRELSDGKRVYAINARSISYLEILEVGVNR